MGYNNTRTAALDKIKAIAETESDLNQLSFACAALKELADGGFLTGIDGTKIVLAERLTTIINTSTSMEDIAYASRALNKLEVSADDIAASEVYSIGTAGSIGFGVSALRAEEVPAGYTLPTGHTDRLSPNYGLVIDPAGSYMRFIREFWFRWNGNVAEVRSQATSGFVKHEAFRHCTIGFLCDTTHVSLLDVGSGLVPIAVPGNAPASTSGANNGIGQLGVDVANNYAGFINAFKNYRSASHHVQTVFEQNALAILAKAHSAAAPTVFECAFNDVAPYLPKGNNNNALRDTNDSSVEFTSAGNESYPQCALTASASNLAKTTHNGQACGVADVNGNLWRVNIGLTKLNNTDSIFKILKTTVDPNSITVANLHDAANYDDLDLTGLVDGNNGWVYLGNGTEQVFDTSIDSASLAFRQACSGLPLATAVGLPGTTEFGNDGLYRYWRSNMLPISGGRWNSSSTAGVFARYLYHYSTHSNYYVGGSACVSL